MSGLPTRGAVAASIGLAALVCVAVSRASHLLEPLELLGYDWLLSRQGFWPPGTSVVFVDFDEVSMRALDRRYPLPREKIAAIVEKAAAGGATVIGLDVLLSDPGCPPEHDARLAAVIAAAGNVVLASTHPAPEVAAESPLPPFAAAALDVGYANLRADADGFVRRFQPALRSPEYQGIAFSVALATQYAGEGLKPRRSPSGRLEAYALKGAEVPADAERGVLVGFWRPGGLTRLSAIDVLAEGFAPAVFRGRLVVVGQTSDVKDLFFTPATRLGRQVVRTPGAEIHAAAAATLLEGRGVRALGPVAQWAFNGTLAVLVLALLILARPAWSLPAVLLVTLAIYAAAVQLFAEAHVWVRVASTATVIVLALAVGLGYRLLYERRLKAAAEAERREVMNLFERYVSPEVAHEIWERRLELVLQGQERTATVLFSDIRDFTALSSGRPSAEVLAWLNEYLTAMSEIVKSNGGFLNKFIGDGIMVVFGVPLSRGAAEDAAAAVGTALEMIARLDSLNARPGAIPIRIGIGIHTGPLTAGNVGSPDRLEYSVIGETVNLASRLEALSKTFKTSLVVSPSTAELLAGRFVTTLLGESEVRGIPGRTAVYTAARLSPPEA